MPKTYIVISDSEDEIDLISSRASTLVASGSATPFDRDSGTPVSPRRVLRTRSNAHTTPKNKPLQQSALKRKRATSNAAEAKPMTLAAAGKKSKVEDKKLNTIVINSKKVAIEAARRRWLYKHRTLFESLLPPSSSFFVHLEKELKTSTDKDTYKPLHQLDEQPKLVTGGQLKDYQLQGLSFLTWMYHNGMNCILGDEMGLGKTLQTLSLLAYIRERSKGHIDPHLIICPLSVVETWVNEIKRWIPSFKALRFHAQQNERTRLKAAIRDGDITFDICVTTYDSFVSEDSWFKTRRWTYVVLDEGHKIKNADTIVAHKLQGIGSMYRLVLTGTPVQNNLLELWGLLRWLYPSVFGSSSDRLFRESFDLEKGTYSLPFLAATEKLLSTVMLRRTKDTVDIKVPPREELTVFLPMAEAQRFWTYRLLTRLDSMELQEIFTSKSEDEKENERTKEVKAYLSAKIEQGKTGQQNQWKRLMNLLIQLRQICDHPYLLPNAEPSPYALGDHVPAASSKLVFLDKLLADILPNGERVLIFSQWTGMLDLLEDFLTLRSIAYSRLDGSTPRPRRTLDVKLFQQEVSPFQVFLISTKAGGLGINLTKASTVVMIDSDWNPQNDLQAIARAHRIGQTKTVKVYRLICQGSVEDQMLDRIRRKLFLSIKVMNAHSDASEEQATALKTHELMSILRKGSSAISRADGDGLSLSEFLDAPIDSVLQASRSRDDMKTLKMRKDLGDNIKQEEDEKLLVDAEEEEKRLLSGIAQVQSRLFEGKVVQRAQKANKDIAAEWEALQKRARQTRIVVIDGYEVIAAHLGPTASTPIAPKVQKKTRKFEWEDWCIYCRDGGELVLCGSCPRVFHHECHGLSPTAVEKMPMVTCGQHRCGGCDRNTSDAGGMLFRCRTCPLAFCEDCLPPGDIDAIGDTLPEFLVRGYGHSGTAYYIQCHHCKERFEADPVYRAQWQEEFHESEAKLEKLRTAEIL